MTGAFAEAVAVFTAQGVPVVPTLSDVPAKPMVKQPARFGVRACRKLSENPRFKDANAGIWTGRRSGLTIVDIDSVIAGHLSDALNAFGGTPLIVSTPSGGWHLYYRHFGEPRRIRPFGDDLPLDILGNGLAVVPPSIRPAMGKKSAGEYRVIEGDLNALERLPVIRSGVLPPTSKANVGSPGDSRHDLRALREGEGRDNALFAFARTTAWDVRTESELVEKVLAENAKMAEPLPLSVAQAKAATAWRYKTEGRLLTPGSRAAVMDLDDVAICASNPAAFLMLAVLRSHHAPGHVFAIVPEAICVQLQMGHNTARRARNFLLAASLIELVKAGGLTRDGREPNLYRLKAIRPNWEGIELTHAPLFSPRLGIAA